MRRSLLSSGTRTTVLGFFALAALGPSACKSDEPPPPREPGCLTSHDCAEHQICVDRACVDAGMGGTGGISNGAGGVDDGGMTGVVAIELSGAGGQLGEDACVELCVAARHCPGVDPHYDCDSTCGDSNDRVATTGCDDAWSAVLRCTESRGPCAACQNELKVLYACVDRYCSDHQGSEYCSL